MSWVVVGVGLAASAYSSNSSSRRSQNAASVAADRVSPYLLNTGYTTGVNTGDGSAGNSSFTFGGNTGAFNSTGATTGASVASGFTGNASTTGNVGIKSDTGTYSPLSGGQGFYQDNTTGQIYDVSGNPVDGNYVPAGDSQLNLNVPTFNIDGQLAGLASSTSALEGIAGDFSNVAGQFSLDQENPGELLKISNQAGELLPRVAVGASEMRQYRNDAIQAANSATTSDLKDSMSRRRISGSSFADDTLSRNQAEFAQLQSEADAASTLEELEATASILGFQAQVIETSGNLVLNALAGELSAQQSIANNQIAGAQLILQRDQSIFNADASALSLAFQGTQQAQNYVLNLMQVANGATGLQLQGIQQANDTIQNTSGALISAGINSSAA